MNQNIKSKADALKYAIEFTAEDGKLNCKAAQELFDFICKNLSVYEGAVEEAQNPRCSVIAEGTKEKEEDGTVPGYPNSISEENKYLYELLHNRGYTFVSRMSSNGFRDRLYSLENDNESLEVIINRILKVIARQRDKNKIISNDTEAEITAVRRYLLAKGYKMTTDINEPKTFVHPKLNIKIAFC